MGTFSGKIGGVVPPGDPSTMSCEELKANYASSILLYDTDGSKRIELTELQSAINDYYDGKITYDVAAAIQRTWELNCDLSD